MDDELCDTVMMGAVQLQATFSVVCLSTLVSIQRGSNATRRGTLEQRLHTRYDRFAVCVTVIACLALHHHRRAAHSEHNLHSTLSATCTTFMTVLVQL
jgi:hypothetical protein